CWRSNSRRRKNTTATITPTHRADQYVSPKYTASGYSRISSASAAARMASALGVLADDGEDIVDRACSLEFIRLDFLVDQVLHLHDQVDGINAVQVQVRIEIGFRRDGLDGHFKVADQYRGQVFKDGLAIHDDDPHYDWLSMKALRAFTEAKCFLVSSELASSLTWYFFWMCRPSSSASMESRPSPSTNSGSLLSISSGVMSSRSRQSMMSCLSSSSRSAMQCFPCYGQAAFRW